MSGEEAPAAEDRKLSAVKSWFTRSVSFGGVHGSSTALAAAAASKGLSEGNGHNGEDQEAWGGFNITLKQLSMRRSKAGNENSYERETALGSPSMTPRNVSPLVPLTPLRWKSSPPEPEEQEKSAVAVERSRLGLRVTNSSDNNIAVQTQTEEQDSDHMIPATPFEGFRPKPFQQTTADEDDEEEEEEEDENDESSSSSAMEDMKASSGEDVMTMTIDFLRVRLLAEHSASKAAKQRIQELSRKVMELELKLEQVIEEKNKAEKSAEEALLKLLTGDFAQVADCTARAAQNRAVFSSTEALHNITSAGSGSGGEEIKEELLSVGDFSRTTSIASSVESKNSRKSQDRNEEDASGRADLWVTPKNMFVSDGESPKKQEKRAAIENRLRSMWTQISADMSALAGDRSQEALAQEQLMNWMDQVPAVLQNRVPQKSPEDMISQDSKLILSPPEGIQDKAHVRTRSDAEIMLEEYEAHKRVQREWERNYYESKQRLEQSKGTRNQVTGSKQSEDAAMGAHRSKSSIDFRHHPHLLNHSEFESWGGDQHSRYSSNAHPDHRQRLAYDPSPMEHPAERPLRAHEPESREWQQEYEDNYLQQLGSQQGVRRQIGYPDAQSRSSVTRSAEDPFRINPQHGNGAVHPMWDYRASLGPTHGYRPRERDEGSYRQSENQYSHSQHRSADRSNWPTEEDNRRMDHPYQQGLSGEICHTSYHGKAAHSSFRNGDSQQSYEVDLPSRHETPHQHDMYLDAKTNGSGPPPHCNNPAKAATDPKLYLGYGPAHDAPREHAPMQPLQQDQALRNKSSITDVLLALKKAKASIQKSEHVQCTAGITNQLRAGSEPVKSKYGLWTAEHDDLGVARIRPLNSAPSLNYDPTAMNLKPAANGHSSYVDQLTVGKGIDYFF